jgi:hypothetical protein
VLHRDPKYPVEAYQQTVDTLLRLLIDYGYQLMHIDKNADKFRLKQVNRFSDKVMKIPDVYTECDYLFVPGDHDWKLHQWLMT